MAGMESAFNAGLKMKITAKEISEGWDVSDEEIEDALGRFVDGAWSNQTKEIIISLGAKGIDLNQNWAITPQYWRCPSCSRTKPEIAKTNQSGVVIAHIVEHHDHIQLYIDEWKIRVKARGDQHIIPECAAFRQIVRAISVRFSSILMCEDCNNADAKAKGIVGCCDKYFSFSPSEIGNFISVSKNSAHSIAKDKAVATFNASLEAHVRRLDHVNLLLSIMEEGRHWISKQDGDASARDEPDRYWKIYKSIISDRIGEYSIGDERIILSASCRRDGFGTKQKIKAAPPQKIPTHAEFVAHKPESPLWDKVADDWRCPVCQRSKFEVLRWNPKKLKWSGKIVAGTAIKDQVPALGCAEGEILKSAVCEDCNNVNAHISQRHSWMWRLNADEIRAITKFTPHTQHQINFDMLDVLFPDEESDCDE